jgi:hypothetical protein
LYRLTPDAPPPAGLNLETARHTGWRFLIHRGDEVLAAAVTTRTVDGDAFSHFAEGPFVQATLRAVQQARHLTATTSVTYEARLLSVPGLYMMALWLYPDAESRRSDTASPAALVSDPTRGATDNPAAIGAPGTDLLFPLAPAPLGLAAYRPYRADLLLPVLAGRTPPAPLLTSPV